jgi:hypothetical protein
MPIDSFMAVRRSGPKGARSSVLPAMTRNSRGTTNLAKICRFGSEGIVARQPSHTRFVTWFVTAKRNIPSKTRHF